MSKKYIKNNGNSLIANFQKILYFSVSFKSGKYAFSYNYDGKKHIDFLVSASSANLGNGHKKVAQFIFK